MSRLDVGAKAPEFSLPNQDGDLVSLTDFAGKNLIIFFYPAAMTPGCTKEACDFRDSLEPLKDAGYAVIGISPDTPAKLRKFVEQEQLTYPLLSDESKHTLAAYGAYGEKKLYGKTVVGVIRSTIVVDGDGVITVARYNVKATGHVASLKKGLRLPAE